MATHKKGPTSTNPTKDRDRRAGIPLCVACGHRKDEEKKKEFDHFEKKQAQTTARLNRIAVMQKNQGLLGRPGGQDAIGQGQLGRLDDSLAEGLASVEGTHEGLNAAAPFPQERAKSVGGQNLTPIDA